MSEVFQNDKRNMIFIYTFIVDGGEGIAKRRGRRTHYSVITRVPPPTHSGGSMLIEIFLIRRNLVILLECDFLSKSST